MTLPHQRDFLFSRLKKTLDCSRIWSVIFIFHLSVPQPLVAGPVNRMLLHPTAFCLVHTLVLRTSGTCLSLTFSIGCFSPSYSFLSMCKLSSGFLQISYLKSYLFVSVIHLQKLTRLSLSVTFRSRAGNRLSHISSL